MLLAPGVPARAANSVERSSFPRPSALEPNVDFWVNAFTYWGQRDFVLHDRDEIWRIYQVFHMPGEGAASGEEVKWANAYLKDKYAELLNRLATGQQPDGYDEQRVAAMFKGKPLSAYADAAQNLRVQQGLRQPFRAALLRARYYCPRMERVFEDFGLPPELVALAAVESGYHARARSSAGAVGIWQFTRSTGRQFLRITRYRDDRLDPMRSTVAAARLLQSNYDSLGSWPLAITAYDYGTAGMARASAAYGDNLVRILRRYAAPHFGFAVKNYYAEFLAAAQVHKYEDKYFPGIQYEEASPPRPSSPILRRVAHHHRHRYRHYRHYRHRGHFQHVRYLRNRPVRRPKRRS
jgi:peptidoglycan lytic transglycosylase D